ncbi:MAG: hypothetical protein H0T79_23925, partial [Deltaproteobacteria bacterium]|nr:hypothetical protein [Deltaproteobacteria bacterium]
MSDDDDDDRGDLSGGRTPAAIRAETMEALRAKATELFTRRPTFRSLLLSVAQYWADEADDAVHANLVGSERATPVWPHACDLNYGDDQEPRLLGEACWDCDDDFGSMDFDDNGAQIVGFEAFCHEDGNQEEPAAENYMPYAIARRVGDTDEIAIEIVGTRVRTDGHAEPIASEESELAPWPDARAKELFAQVCASPDDGPRHVLADHLQERGDPRGEYLALALAAPDAGARLRRDALLAEHRALWMDPLGTIIPQEGARFARGFLVHADVFVTDPALVAETRGAEAWGTLESLRYLDGSLDVLDPTMVALREVGVLDGDAVQQLFATRRPWAIESLTMFANAERATLVALQRTTLLPRLRRLGIVGDHKAALALLPEAAWWPQLERVTLYDATEISARTHLHGVPVVAFADTNDSGQPTGWELALLRDHRVEVTMAGWQGKASFAALTTRMTALPAEYRSFSLA